MDDQGPAEVSRCLAWGMDLPEFEGRIYRLGEPTQGVKAEFEAYLKQQAMRDVIEASKGLPEAEDVKNRKLLFKDFGLGRYRWGGPVWREAISEEDTLQQLVFLMLEDGESKKPKGKNPVSRELVYKMLQDEVAGPWLMASVFYASGVDPTLALAMARVTFAGAKEMQEKALAKMKELISPASAAN